MKNRIEKLVPIAIDVAEDLRAKDKYGNLKKEKGEFYIQKKFKSYISSFGASVIQSGLIPALAFYSNDEGSNKERSRILKSIYKILEINSPSKNLLKYAVDEYKKEGVDKELLKDQIMDAATALKLAIRTFKLVKE